MMLMWEQSVSDVSLPFTYLLVSLLFYLSRCCCGGSECPELVSVAGIASQLEPPGQWVDQYFREFWGSYLGLGQEVNQSV